MGKKKLYQPKPIHLENHSSSKRISGRLQTLKQKLEKQNMNIVNLTIAFTCQAWSSTIKDFPWADDIKPNQGASQKFQNCEIV